MQEEFVKGIGDTNKQPQYTFFYCQKVSVMDVLRLIEKEMPGTDLEKVYLLPTAGCVITPDTSLGVDPNATTRSAKGIQ